MKKVQVDVSKNLTNNGIFDVGLLMIFLLFYFAGETRFAVYLTSLLIAYRATDIVRNKPVLNQWKILPSFLVYSTIVLILTSQDSNLFILSLIVNFVFLIYLLSVPSLSKTVEDKADHIVDDVLDLRNQGIQEDTLGVILQLYEGEKHIQKLFLSDNSIKEIDLNNILNQFPNLRELDLSRNKISVVDLSQMDYDSIITIDLTENPISKLVLGSFGKKHFPMWSVIVTTPDIHSDVRKSINDFNLYYTKNDAKARSENLRIIEFKES